MSLTDHNQEQYFHEVAEANGSFMEQMRQEDAGNNALEMRIGITAAANAFEFDIEEYENGNVSAIDTAVKFKEEIEKFESLIENRKAWLDENKTAIVDDSEKYPEGYKKLKFSIRSTTKYVYDKIPQWNTLNDARKEIEDKAKLAIKMIEKGITEPADATTGELLPIPEVKVSSYLKTDRVK